MRPQEILYLGRFVKLQPPDPAELARLDALRHIEPRTPQTFARDFSLAGPLGPMLVRGVASHAIYGVVDGFMPMSQSDVVELTVFLDPHRSLPGAAIEAYLLYARALFHAGVRTLRISILDGDQMGRRVMGRIGLRAQVRMREHQWSGGRLHDLLIYVVHVEEVARIDSAVAAALYRRRGVPC